MMKKKKILIADDDPKIRRILQIVLSKEGYEIHTAKDGLEAKEMLMQHNYSAILADVKMPGVSGIELIEIKNEYSPWTSIIIITAYGTIKSAVEAVKKGAFDYITKPFDTEEIRRVTAMAVKMAELEKENKHLKDTVEEFSLERKFVGKADIVKKMLEEVQKASLSDATVLIQGESGTGKSLVAEMIHKMSKRSSYPFVKINCSAIPEALLESELFGYEKGAFTGAGRRKPGKFEIADGGTVFLDEIGDMPLGLQAKLLHIIEEKELDVLGSVRPKKIDVRFIAATNKNLPSLVKEGQFRQDLYYRLNVFPITVPPLRERKEDIPLLVEHFIKLSNKEQGKNVKGVTNEVMDIFMRYNWPGNVRELKNIIERGVILCEDELICVEYIPPEVKSFTEKSEGVKQHDFSEKQKIIEALEKAKWNKSKAARMLNMTRNQLRYRLRKLGLE